MAESLLTPSAVLLFGRKVEDLVVRPGDQVALVVATRKVPNLRGHIRIDGVRVGQDDIVLVAGNTDAENALYAVGAASANWVRQADVPQGQTVFVEEGRKHAQTMWKQTAIPAAQKFSLLRSRQRLGQNQFLDRQLSDDACFARIYGFSYEGTYYDLPNPTMFLVHGDGESATDNSPTGQGSRAPFGPSRSGVAAADYQMANDIMVWNYDKADYTIRMDVVTGMFEQVLLDLYFGFDSPGISGAKVSGAKVSGAKVSGAKVSGAKVSGAKARGPSD